MLWVTLDHCMPAPPTAIAARARFWYSAFGLVLTLTLISWGGVVTTMEAGLAVPDWPSSFGSFDPVATGYSDPANPDARWWHVPAILAEHGHRLLGAVVGLWVIGLVLWTWIADPRKWMRYLALAALGLIVAQGILGGLRVIWESLDLAVVHAMGAQLVFSSAAALTLFTSGDWLTRFPPGSIGALTVVQPDITLRKLTILTTAAVLVQILFGALLRHPGAGVDLTFILVHVTGSVVALTLILVTAAHIRNHCASNQLLSRGASVMIAMLIAQMLLGVFALIVILYDSLQVSRSLAQMVLSSAHLAVGAVLMATVVCVMVCSLWHDQGQAVPEAS